MVRFDLNFWHVDIYWSALHDITKCGS